MDKLYKLPETKLFRYDLKCPPPAWSNDFYSVEYSKDNKGETKYKNNAGLFFFFENKNAAMLTAEKAMNRFWGSKIWLTSTTTKEEANLLDLRGGATLAMMNLLWCADIDIFNQNMTVSGMGDDTTSLSCLETLFFRVIDSNVPNDEDYHKAYLDLHKPFVCPGNPFSLLGQRLTDYENGSIFKQLLKEKNYDGYIFDESFGGSTICLLNAEKLTNPICEEYNRKRMSEWKRKYYQEIARYE